MTALGLHCYIQAFSSCCKWGLLSSCSVLAYCGGFSCYGAWVLGCTGFSSCSFWALEHRLSSCGPWANCSVEHGIFPD